MKFRKNLTYLLQKDDPDAVSNGTGITVVKLNSLAAGEASASIEEADSICRYFRYSLDELVHRDLDHPVVPEKGISLLVLDVDGVMTDGGMYFAESGDEFKKFNTKDGRAIKQLLKRDIHVAFLSSGINHNLIKNRAALLGVKYVYAGLAQKKEVLDAWLKELGISYKDIAYIGDDLNDLAVMTSAAYAAAPADADPGIRKIADFLLRKKGGEGCVREFVNDYLPWIWEGA